MNIYTDYYGYIYRYINTGKQKKQQQKDRNSWHAQRIVGYGDKPN